MPSFSQSTRLVASLTDVVHLLRFAPYLVRSQAESAVLHYHLPSGIWQGAPVYYALVKGMHVVRWQSSVLNPTGRGFFARSSSSPFGVFQASHLFEQQGNATIMRDEFTMDSAEFGTALQVVFHLAQRQEMSAAQAEEPTRELPRLDSGFAAG